MFPALKFTGDWYKAMHHKKLKLSAKCENSKRWQESAHPSKTCLLQQKLFFASPLPISQQIRFFRMLRICARQKWKSGVSGKGVRKLKNAQKKCILFKIRLYNRKTLYGNLNFRGLFHFICKSTLQKRNLIFFKGTVLTFSMI